ncbi:MAG: hypothetical protein IID45_04690 [Planctomycetes bacterium]|nr:hypothetical protein [Planctomycetota bacterium]
MRLLATPFPWVKTVLGRPTDAILAIDYTAEAAEPGVKGLIVPWEEIVCDESSHAPGMKRECNKTRPSGSG